MRTEPCKKHIFPFLLYVVDVSVIENRALGTWWVEDACTDSRDPSISMTLSSPLLSALTYKYPTYYCTLRNSRVIDSLPKLRHLHTFLFLPPLSQIYGFQAFDFDFYYLVNCTLPSSQSFLQFILYFSCHWESIQHFCVLLCTTFANLHDYNAQPRVADIVLLRLIS